MNVIIRLIDSMCINLWQLQDYARNDDIATNELFDLISRMLCYDPEKRTTAREALQDNFFKRKLVNVNKSSLRSCSRSESL